MRHVIAGTAGHVDHGKTALVRALTGVDTDRLDEEKRRGISIDIGFAHLDLERNLRLAFIDVPGHEKFVKNMLAGVGGIDFIVFVIAADESIMPQTREHFEICRLLRIRSGLIALTKCDLVDQDTIEVAKLEIADFVRGSFLENAPILPISATTGMGLDVLRSELARVAQHTNIRDKSQFFRLPVDRSFVMSGFGTVATGTVFGGHVQIDDEVQAYPGSRILRVRGVQVHGRNADQAVAGQRAAINIAGIESHEIHRGMTLATKSVFVPTTLCDAVLELLSSAKPLKNRAPVHLHAGTAQVQAEVRTLDNAPLIQPGSSALIRLVLKEPLLLLPGDRFIIRMFSPVVTIGGGEVLDCDPPRRLPRSGLHARAKRLAACSLQERISLFVEEAQKGMSLASLVARTGLRPETLRQSMPADVVQVDDWLLHRSTIAATLKGCEAYLKSFHREHPLLPGCSKEELRSRYLGGAPPHVFDALLGHTRQIVATGEFVRLASHTIALQADEQEASTRMEAAFEAAGLQVPSLSDALRSSGIDATRSRTLLQLSLKRGRLVRVTDELVFHVSAILALKEILAARKGQRFSVSDFKDWTGISRKYAIPLLEWLDRERITRRDGDMRLIL